MKKILQFIKNSQNEPKRLLYYILIFGFILRLGFILILDPHGFYFSDTRHYDGAALSLLAGEGWGVHYDREPLYPLFMAGVYGIFGHSFVIMRLVEALLGTLLCYLIFIICQKSFSIPIALIAAFLGSFFPHFILIVGILYSTNLFTILLALAIIFILKADEKKSIFYSALAGVVGGLTALTSPSMFFIFPFWLVWIFLQFKRSFVWKTLLAVVFFAAFALTLMPWTIRNYVKYDRFVLVRPVPHTVFPDLNDIEGQKQKIDQGFKDTTEYLKKNPTGGEKDKVGNIFANYFKHPVKSFLYMTSELGHFWALFPDRLDTQSASYQESIQAKDGRMRTTRGRLWQIVKIASICFMSPIFICAIIGLLTMNPFYRQRLLLLFTILAVSMGYSLIVAEVRYRIPVEPYVLMFTSAGIFIIINFIKNKFPSNIR